MPRYSLVLAGILAISCEARGQHPIAFEVRVLTVDANEGCAIADFDNDGKLDIVAGRNWFRNGEWLARTVRVFGDVNDYAMSNGDWVWDVNGDGRMDVVAGGFFDPKVKWYENPGPLRLHQGLCWPVHDLVDTGLMTNEASYLHDIDGDGVPEWITNQWVKESPLIIWRLVTKPRELQIREGDQVVIQNRHEHALEPTIIGHKNGHGIGFGDVNNDGREDILVGAGWYERPAGNPFTDPWVHHADWDREFSCPMLVRDVDQDGKNDIVWGNPHDFGVYFWKAKGPDAAGKLHFEEIEIDRTFSQAHCIHFADLDGDGQDELIAGKRVRAHNELDPGAADPAEISYFVWDATQGAYQKHLINRGDVGVGLQIRTADIDGDGDLDIVVAGKEGTQLLLNRLK